jgi:hypothetical protein
MARYIKANPKVAAYLHLENDRLKLKDGNYILWQGDMTAFGPLPMLNETLTQIGGIALMRHEAKQEQDGAYNRPLPVATDERFIMDEATDPEPQTDDEAEAVTDENGEGQAPAAASTEEPTDDEGDGDTDEEPAEAEAEAEAESETTESDNPETE